MPKFPTNVSFLIKNQTEHDEFMRGLETLSAENTPFALIVDRVCYHDEKGIVQHIVDAYVETGGKRIGEGTEAEMQSLFSREIAGHSATVRLFVRKGLDYKNSRSRIGG